MQFKLFTVSALAAAASAATSSAPAASATPSGAASTTMMSGTASGSAATTSLNPAIVLSILQTAVPQTLFTAWEAHPSQVQLSLASEFKAGTTPSWFTALPTAVQGYIIQGLQGNTTGVANVTGLLNSSTVIVKTTTNSKGKPTTISKTSALITKGKTTGGAGGSKPTGSSAGSSGTSSSSSGMAALPTAMVGAGLAGVVGIVGLFAL